MTAFKKSPPPQHCRASSKSALLDRALMTLHQSEHWRIDPEGHRLRAGQLGLVHAEQGVLCLNGYRTVFEPDRGGKNKLNALFRVTRHGAVSRDECGGGAVVLPSG